MSEQDTDVLLNATTALVPAMLTAIDLLQHAGRHLHPPRIAQLAGEVEPYRQPLKDGLEQFDAVAWPEHLTGFSAHASRAAGAVLKGMDEFLSAPNQSNPAMAAYRALGYNTRALEDAYVLAMMLPPVSRFFIDPEAREDAALAARLNAADMSRDNVGVMHADNDRDSRGGFSMYVPEYYDGEAVPLVVALHGGSGHGRSFLWTWLRAARTANAIVISPTSREGTWSLMGPDVDSENLYAMVAYAREHWTIDPERILLTGMSDGGTFSYVSGLQSNAPFTHLAPSSASFHPMLVEVADAERLKDLPVYLMHGALDWMFPVEVARTARDALTAAGAKVVYREIDDLSHTYPAEENPRILHWLATGEAPSP